jgi:chromosome segregation ATPase
MKIRECKVCGAKPLGIFSSKFEAIRYYCPTNMCPNAATPRWLSVWNTLNKPEKPDKPDKLSKKDREIARLTEIVDMSKADLVKAAEKIAELTRDVAFREATIDKQVYNLAEYADKIGELSNRCLGLSLDKEGLTNKIDELSAYIDEREKSEEELCALVELMKKENLEATEKIAELTNTIDTQKTYIKKVLERVAKLEDENTNICNDYNNEVMGRSLDVINYTAKLDKLSAENVMLHNKLIAAVGVDEAFDA